MPFRFLPQIVLDCNIFSVLILSPSANLARPSSSPRPLILPDEPLCINLPQLESRFRGRVLDSAQPGLSPAAGGVL